MDDHTDHEPEIREIGGTAGRDIARRPGQPSPMSQRIKEYFATPAAHENFMAGFNEGMAGSPFAQTLFAGRPFKDGETLDDFAHWEFQGGKLVLSKDLPEGHDESSCEECQRAHEAVERFYRDQDQKDALRYALSRDDEIVDAEIVDDATGTMLPLTEDIGSFIGREIPNKGDVVQYGRYEVTNHGLIPVDRPLMDSGYAEVVQDVDHPRENRTFVNEEGTKVEDVSLAGNGLLQASLEGDVGRIVRAAPTNATKPTEKGWTAQSARRQQHLDSIPDDMTEAEWTAKQIRDQKAAAYAVEASTQQELAREQHPSSPTEAAPASGQDAGGQAQAAQAQPTEVPLTHVYVSTACQHGLHKECRKRCKFCDAPCVCPHHIGDVGED